MSIFMSFSKRKKVDVNIESFNFSPADPILSLPSCDMKFSGMSTSRTRHCPPGQVDLLRQVAGLATTNFIGSQEEMRCNWWTLRSDTTQFLYDWRGRQIFEARVVPSEPKSCFSFSSFFGTSNKALNVDSQSGPLKANLKVKIKDALGMVVLSLVCKRFLMSFPDRKILMGSNEMEVFLGEYKLHIGTILELPVIPGSERFSGIGVEREYYAVYDEKGTLVYYVYLSESATIHSSHVQTFTITGFEKMNDVGMIKCSRRTLARWVPKCFFGYGPAVIRFKEDVELPIPHKCLLIGTLFFIVTRTLNGGGITERQII